jgi:hypothetical protein
LHAECFVEISFHRLPQLCPIAVIPQRIAMPGARGSH